MVGQSIASTYNLGTHIYLGASHLGKYVASVVSISYGPPYQKIYIKYISYCVHKWIPFYVNKYFCFLGSFSHGMIDCFQGCLHHLSLCHIPVSMRFTWDFHTCLMLLPILNSFYAIIRMHIFVLSLRGQHIFALHYFAPIHESLFCYGTHWHHTMYLLLH